MKRNIALFFAFFMAVCLWIPAVHALNYLAIIHAAESSEIAAAADLRDNPVIILAPVDSLNCSNYDFEQYTWLPYSIDAQVLNAESIQWSTSGDGTFNNENIANPNYFLGREDKLNNRVVLTITATGNNTIVSSEITVNIPMQLIPITGDGDTGLSSFVEKSDTPVPEVMAPVVENLVILITVAGNYYWPEPTPPINQIGNWGAVGYKARFKNSPACLPIYGNPVDQSYLVYGFMSYLPVLTDYPVAIEELFAGHLDNIQEIFDYKDSLTWTPANHEFDILKPGLAYRLLLYAPYPSFFIEYPPFSWDLPINIPSLETSDANIYPNPSDGIFYVKINKTSESATWEVINTEAKTIRDGIESENFTINLTSQPKGIYYLKITQGGLNWVKKLVLQ